MTIHTNITGYQERPYLSEGYLSAGQYGNDGMQVEFVIADTPKELGMQADFNIEDLPNALGMQTNFNVVTKGIKGMQFKADTLSHKLHGVYLEDPYLEGPYLVEQMCTYMGMQIKLNVSTFDETGMQTQLEIEDFLNNQGMQTTFTILDDLALGMQMNAQRISVTGMQFLATLYNTTNLRILCDFQSRGDSSTTGTNEWGNASGVGLNWKVNVATDPGPDHGIENLNTDIVEQTWKSNGIVSGINIDCDAERAQGIFMDTFSIQNHNVSRGGTITLFGSNDPTFSAVGLTRSIEIIDEPNCYHIEETLPSTSYKYWRISIDDPTNPDGFIEIGTVLFGASSIFSGECITDEIELELQDFADTIATEGFTNIANSRAQKKFVVLQFRSLAFERGNYQIIREIFTFDRTVLKCLWIPTPDLVDTDFMARFAVFAKIVSIPRERHNSKGRKLDFASFTLELDESK